MIRNNEEFVCTLRYDFFNLAFQLMKIIKKDELFT